MQSFVQYYEWRRIQIKLCASLRYLNTTQVNFIHLCYLDSDSSNGRELLGDRFHLKYFLDNISIYPTI